jgi:Immunity protein 44
MNWETQSIWTNYMLDRVSDSKIKTVDAQVMNVLGNLNVKNYTLQLDRVVVVLVALPPSAWPEKECLIFRKNMNKIEIRIKLDYEALLQADEAQTLRLIANTYLSAINRFLSKRKDFDYQAFYTDVEKLFREKGYL